MDCTKDPPDSTANTGNEMFSIWYSSLCENTRKAYQKAWEITRAHIGAWAISMRRSGLAETTIQLRLAGISSLYRYAIEEYEIINPDGTQTTLAHFNPVKGKSLRINISPYGKATHLTNTQIRAILSSISRNSVLGLRDYALLLTYLATGRRNSEIRNLHWGDIEQIDDRIWYHWSGKGKRNQRSELLKTAWLAICEYLRAAGRQDSIQTCDYIFTAILSRAKHLPTVNKDWKPFQRPISGQEANKILKRYAEKAGLRPEQVHIHMLRHTWAEVHREVGDDVLTISKGLGHSSISITQVYLDHKRAVTDESWSKVEQLWGLD